MSRESTPEGKKKNKKDEKSNARTRFIATLVTWLLLNLIWLQASQAIAVNEVNEHGREINGNYVLNVPNMMKMDREIPVDLSCDFQPKNSTVPIVWVRIQHETPDGENSIVWEGNSTDDCPDFAFSLTPGKHSFYTTVVQEDGADLYPSRNLSAEMELGMHLWEPFRIEGFVAANLLGLFLGIADRAIRGIIRRRREALIRNMPLHKLRQKEEWEQLSHTMAGGEAVEVEDLVGFQEHGPDESMEMQRRRMREQFAAQSVEADGDTDTFVDDDAIDQDDELGPGTTEGLTGAVEEDRSIRTVGDLWRRLSGNEDKKKRKR
tara:strand:- start:4983 stop:5942 length:960 start_codon:yes stop_codon:yes gene_type:complete